MTLTVEAPTDSQLSYIAALCRNADLPEPQVVASKSEASTIIEALKTGRYRWQDYDYPWVPFR